MSNVQAEQLAGGESDAAVDIIEELRLRTWARLNYVPPEERSESWHPVVLDEMRCRDAEMAGGDTTRAETERGAVDPEAGRSIEPSLSAKPVAALKA